MSKTNLLTLEANPGDAPGCVKLVGEYGASVLFQNDYDWPSVAGLFGWSTYHKHKRKICSGWWDTDGTIDCPKCGRPASEFIASARAWLDDNDGGECLNPGYELEGGEDDETDTKNYKPRLEDILWDTGDHCDEHNGVKMVFNPTEKFIDAYWNLRDYVAERTQGPVLYLVPRKNNENH